MSLLDDLLNHQDLSYTNALTLYMAREEKRRREDFAWKGRIGVSAISSWNCCPKMAIAAAKNSKEWPNKLLWKFALGHAYHDAIQKRAMNTPNLKMIKPWNLPDVQIKDVDILGNKVISSLQQKLEEHWPEYPCCVTDPETGEVIIMGYADEVEVHRKELIVVDFKTENSDELDYKLRFDDVVKDKLAKYELQVSYYLMMMEKYWAPLKPSKGKLIFINTKFEIGDPESFRELIIKPKDEHYVKFHLINKEVARQLRGDDLDCEYRYCYEHM